MLLNYVSDRAQLIFEQQHRPIER